MAVIVHLDPVALQAFARSPQGPILRHSLAVCEQVVSGAKGRVGYSNAEGHRWAHLRDAIVKRIQMVGPLFKVWIEANRPYAEMHHRGTVPHQIRARNAKVLRFQVGGVTVFAQKVEHPGTAPVKFLVDAARDAGLKVVERG